MGESRRLFGENQNILTIPVPAETSWTCGYKDAFSKALDFIAKEGEWHPNVVIVCAGYDALDSDELASCALQANDYGKMSQMLLQHIKETTKTNDNFNQPPILMLRLEGGYQLSRFAGGGNLQQAVVETLQAFM